MFISVEQSGNGVEVYVDEEGRDFLIRQLSTLKANGDYCFFALGAELDESKYWAGSDQVETVGVRMI